MKQIYFSDKLLLIYNVELGVSSNGIDRDFIRKVIDVKPSPDVTFGDISKEFHILSDLYTNTPYNPIMQTLRNENEDVIVYGTLKLIEDLTKTYYNGNYDEAIRGLINIRNSTHAVSVRVI